MELHFECVAKSLTPKMRTSREFLDRSQVLSLPVLNEVAFILNQIVPAYVAIYLQTRKEAHKGLFGGREET